MSGLHPIADSLKTIFLHRMASAIDLSMEALRLSTPSLSATRKGARSMRERKVTLEIPRSRRNSALFGVIGSPHSPAFRMNLAKRARSLPLAPRAAFRKSARDD